MKSTLAILALALGSAAAAEETFIHSSGGHKLRHQAQKTRHGHKTHHDHHTKTAHAVGKELRFAKAKTRAEDFPCDAGMGARESVHWHTDKVTADKYRIKCSEVTGSGRLGCEGGSTWTILKSGYTVACQFVRKDEATGKWVRSKNTGECKGFGNPADGCMRMYQTVPDDIFHEKLR